MAKILLNKISLNTKATYCYTSLYDKNVGITLTI